MNKNKPSSSYDQVNDYYRYWSKRQYEDQADQLALKYLLKRLPKKLNSILDLGCGYGRLVPTYKIHFKTCYLLDSSSKMLIAAKKTYGKNHLVYKIGQAEKLPFNDNTFDCVMMVRTIHHLDNFSQIFKEIFRVLKSPGFLILEYPNKIHFLRLFKKILKGQPFYGFKLENVRINSPTASFPIYNFHPFLMNRRLRLAGFQISKELSVSNFRHRRITAFIPISLLLLLERLTQSVLAFFHWGPSIFVLAKKE